MEAVEVGKTSPECIQKDKIWLTFSHVELTMADKDTITSGGLLSDKHMDFAQALLKTRSNMGSLQDFSRLTLLLASCKTQI